MQQNDLATIAGYLRAF